MIRKGRRCWGHSIRPLLLVQGQQEPGKGCNTAEVFPWQLPAALLFTPVSGKGGEGLGKMAEVMKEWEWGKGRSGGEIEGREKEKKKNTTRNAEKKSKKE